jgi:hypothetical protein
MLSATRPSKDRSFTELTRAVFGESMTVDDTFALVMGDPISATPAVATSSVVWVGSIGYERYKQNEEFARRLLEAGVQRLVDVRELPISRRRGYAKTALSEAMAAVGIEYVHVRALGNPKPYRDLYKSGRAAEGRELYERYLLQDQRAALDDLIGLLSDKRTALMCVEHDARACHRTVILDALRGECGLALEVADIV